MIIAQISDFHLNSQGVIQERVETLPPLKAVLARLKALTPQPDMVVITGDLVNNGKPEDYSLLAGMLDELPMPVYAIPGNHDDRDELRRIFGAKGYLPQTGKFLNFVIEGEPIRVIGLDTQVDGERFGNLCRERRDWLDKTLSEKPDQPTVLMMHHAPFVVGLGFMDKQSFVEPQAFAEVLSRHKQVRKLLCGHLHRHVERDWGGTYACVAPSTAFQMDLRLFKDAKSAFVLEPARILLHMYLDDGGLVTHSALVDQPDGPYPFTRSHVKQTS